MTCPTNEEVRQRLTATVSSLWTTTKTVLTLSPRCWGGKGHQVFVAYSADAALDLARSERPNVFLLDLSMPESDGFTIGAQLRHDLNFKDALIIAVTGYGMECDRARTAAAGFDLHLTKPVDSLKVMQIITTETSANPP